MLRGVEYRLNLKGMSAAQEKSTGAAETWKNYFNFSSDSPNPSTTAECTGD